MLQEHMRRSDCDHLHKLYELAGRQLHAMAVHFFVIGKGLLPAVQTGVLCQHLESAHHKHSLNASTVRPDSWAFPAASLAFMQGASA